MTGVVVGTLSAPAMAEETTASTLAKILAKVENIEKNLGAASNKKGVELPPLLGFPAFDQKAKSLVKQCLTPQIYLEIKDRISPGGYTFENTIQSSVDQQDSGVGLYAGDEECYEVFAPLFDKVIETYHGGYKSTDKHVSDMDASKLVGNSDPEGKYVLSTRIRVGRNVRGLGLSPGVTRAQRRKVEELVVNALNTMPGDMSGKYYSLGNMTEADRKSLIADHFLFKKGDRFLESCGANRDWPESRGIFHTADKKFLVWVNEEDQMRIISMQKGGDTREVFTRLARGIANIERLINEQGYEFSHNDHLGYIHACPTNCGTGMRASVHVKLPNLIKHPKYSELCAQYRLQSRGIHGEHSESEGGVVDLSNKERLGKSEVQLVQTMIDGVSAMIELEKKLAAGQSI